MINQNKFGAIPKVIPSKSKIQVKHVKAISYDLDIERSTRQNLERLSQETNLETHYESNENTIDYEELNAPFESNRETIETQYFYVDREKTPIYMPMEKGKDKEIQLNDGDLFDFELEVEPILEILVRKSLEEARKELITEKESTEIELLKKDYIAKRNIEIYKLEINEKMRIRREEEKNRRELNRLKNYEIKKNSHKKYLSILISKNSLFNLKKNTLNNLESNGVFGIITTQINLKINYLPWLYNNVLTEYNNMNNSTIILNQICFNLNENLLSISKQSFINRKEFLKNELLKKEVIKQSALEEEEKKIENKRIKKVLNSLKNKYDSLKKTIKNLQSSANLIEFKISDVFLEENSSICVFGGFLGEILISLEILNEKYNNSLKKNENDDYIIINEKKILKIIEQILNDKLSCLLFLFINEKYKEIIETGIHENNIELIDEIMKFDDLLYEKSTVKLILDSISEKVKNIMIKTLFEVIFGKKDKNQIKSKIQLVFISNQDYNIIEYEIIRLRIPLNRIEKEEKEENILSIDFFNGNDFKLNQQKYLQIEQKNFNYFTLNNHQNHDFTKKLIVFDERASFNIKKIIFEISKNVIKEFNKFKIDEFLIQTRKLQEKIEDLFLEDFKKNPLETPIYDIEC